MKLSEAIRLGAMLKPQGVLFALRNGKTCALGAAMDAIGALPQRRWFKWLPVADLEPAKARWPELNRIIRHPCSGRKWRLRRVIWDLNDIRGWSREQIADWVEQIEREQLASSAPSEVEAPVTA